MFLATVISMVNDRFWLIIGKETITCSHARNSESMPGGRDGSAVSRGEVMDEANLRVRPPGDLFQPVAPRTAPTY